MLSNYGQRRHHRRGPDRPRELSVPAGPRGFRQGLGPVPQARRPAHPAPLRLCHSRAAAATTGATWRRWPGVYTYLQNIRQDYVIMGRRRHGWSTCPWPKCSSSIWTAVLTSPSVCTQQPEGRPPQHRLHHRRVRDGLVTRSVHQSRSRGQRPWSRWRSTSSPKSCCWPWWTTAPPITSTPSAGAFCCPV